MLVKQGELNYRELATLRAVARGTAELTSSCEPDLFIDGLACCDQVTVHSLVKRGFITPARAARSGERVPAKVTEAGCGVLRDGPPDTNAA